MNEMDRSVHFDLKNEILAEYLRIQDTGHFQHVSELSTLSL